MTIRDKKKFMDALWDWGFLDGCFSHGIRVSDVDGIVERNGHALLIEAKPPGKIISGGQRRMHAELSRSGFHVLVIWGDANAPEACELTRPCQLGGETIRMAADEAKIQEIVRLWFVWANHFPRRALAHDRWPALLNGGVA